MAGLARRLTAMTTTAVLALSSTTPTGASVAAAALYLAVRARGGRP